MDYDRHGVRHGDISVNMDCIMDNELSHEDLGMLLRLAVLKRPFSGDGMDQAAMLNISHESYKKLIKRLEEQGYAYVNSPVLENGRELDHDDTHIYTNRHECGEAFENWRQMAVFIIKQTRGINV